MSKGIKTRNVAKDVKTLDKAATAAERMKDVFVRTKDAAEKTQDSAYSSPSEYAEDKITRAADNTAHEAAYQIEKKGGKAVNKVRDIRRSHKEAKQAADEMKDTADGVRKSANGVKGGRDTGRGAKTASDISKEQMKKRAQDAAKRSGSCFRQSADKTIKTTKQAEKTIKQSARPTGKTIKSTAKGTVKTAQKSVKATKTTIKTTQQAAKAAQKTAQATAKAARMAAQAARAATKAAATAVKIAIKATIAFVKAAILAIKGLIAAIAAGGWVAVVVILVICLIALIVGSVFGIFFSNDPAAGNSLTVNQAVIEINSDFQANIQSQIDEIKSRDTYDEVEIIYEGDIEGDSDMPNNWVDVLTIYAVKYTGEDMDVLTFDETRKAALQDIFNEMNKVSVRYEVETEEVPAESTDHAPSPAPTPQIKKTLIIYVRVASQTYEEAATHYNFTAEQVQMADEMMSPEYYTLFAELLGVDILGGADLTQIRSNLPHGTKGADIVEAALTRLGHPYSQKYRGSKNYVDCSYLAYWAYKQAGVDIPSTSVTQAKYCYDNGYNVGKSELQPGDLIFWSKLSCHCGRWEEIHHVGIYIGDGKTIEASSSSGCVVVRDIWGENGKTWRIHSYARPYV